MFGDVPDEESCKLEQWEGNHGRTAEAFTGRLWNEVFLNRAATVSWPAERSLK
jgi:hypothetical protein